VEAIVLRIVELPWIFSYWYMYSLLVSPGKLFEIKKVAKFKNSIGPDFSTCAIASPIAQASSRKVKLGSSKLIMGRPGAF
jgi:hypothetical protein